MDKTYKPIDVSLDASFESRFPLGKPAMIEYGDKEYISIVRGAMFSKFVLIDIPVFEGKPVVFSKNQKFDVRFFDAGTIYKFSTYLLRMHTKPSLLVLNYPTTVLSHHLRKNERLKVLLPVHCYLNSSEEDLKGFILDISDNGALLCMKVPLKINTDQQLFVSTVLPNGKKIESLPCYICSQRFEDGKNCYGVTFNDNKEHSLNTIKSFYNQCHFVCPNQTETGNETQNSETGMLNAGQEVILEVQKKGIKSFLRGWSKWRDRGYFLIDAPSLHDQVQCPKTGKDFILRYVSNGKFYGTITQFMALLKITNLWALEFHGGILEHSLRKSERFPCLFAARLTVNPNGATKKVGSGFICDLSLDSTRIVSKDPVSLPENNLVNVSFFLNDSQVIKFQKLKIVRRGFQAGNYEYVGLFIKMEKEDREKLQNFLGSCKN